MFRSCTKHSDDSARNAVRSWERGTISLPMLMPDDILVKGKQKVKVNFEIYIADRKATTCI